MQPQAVLPDPAVWQPRPLSAIRIGEQIHIPAWVADLDSFRRWACSDDYPERGWISYLNGEIWVDLSMEEFYSHNQVKGEFAFAIMAILRTLPLGRFIHDRMLLTNPAANLSTEPDGSFAFWETIRSGRLRLIESKREGRCMELEGTPDMVLEIVSDSSVGKDTRILRELYWRAGVPEFWLVDARGPAPKFDILLHREAGYQPAPEREGWLTSEVFGRAFRLGREVDPLGQPLFTLHVQASAQEKP